MSTDTTSRSSDLSSIVAEQLSKLLASKSRLGVVFGLVLIGIGMLLQNGAMAGMLGVYGATSILISVTIRLVLIGMRRKE